MLAKVDFRLWVAGAIVGDVLPKKFRVIGVGDMRELVHEDIVDHLFWEKEQLQAK